MDCVTEASPVEISLESAMNILDLLIPGRGFIVLYVDLRFALTVKRKLNRWVVQYLNRIDRIMHEANVSHKFASGAVVRAFEGGLREYLKASEYEWKFIDFAATKIGKTDWDLA